MKKNRSLFLLILVFVLLLGGAYALYGRLSRSVPSQQLSLQGVLETEGSPETQRPSADAQKTDDPVPDPSETTPPQVGGSPAVPPEATPPQTGESPAVSPEATPPQTGEPPADDPQANGPGADEPAAEEEDPGKPLAPDFTAYDKDGNEAHLSDYLGKPVILNFWASWCGPCQGEMPDFNDAYGELGGDIQFLMVNMTSGRETLERAASFIEEQGYSFPVLYDTQGEAALAYSVYSLPTTFFIDPQGHAIAQAIGAIDRDTLQKGIDMIWTQ